MRRNTIGIQTNECTVITNAEVEPQSVFTEQRPKLCKCNKDSFPKITRIPFSWFTCLASPTYSCPVTELSGVKTLTLKQHLHRYDSPLPV